jgi:hypothetical protein
VPHREHTPEKIGRKAEHREKQACRRGQEAHGEDAAVGMFCVCLKRTKTANPSGPSRPRTQKLRHMSSVRPTRGQPDNPAGSHKPLHNDWLPVVRISSWPGAHAGSNKRGRRYECRRDPLRSSPSSSFRRGKTSTTESSCFLRRRKLEIART